MSRLKSMSVGFLDWQGSNLSADFYPEDLPEDWRADYYFNYFRVAMAPQAEWIKWSDDFICGLDEAMLAENMMYLVWPCWTLESEQQLIRIYERLGVKLGGLLLYGDWSEGDYETIAPRLASLPKTLVQANQSTWVLSEWQWTYNNVLFSGAPLAYFSNLPSTLRAQRDLVDQFKASLPASSAVPVFVDPAQITLQEVMDLASMIELLGY